MKRLNAFILALFTIYAAHAVEKPNIMVLTDIGEDPDDIQSMIRFLVYANEFQARLDWCVAKFADANHSPVAFMNGDSSNNVLIIKGTPGQTVELDATGSSDPDKNALSYKWWIYTEATTYSSDAFDDFDFKLAISDQTLSAGSHDFVWDSTDELGRKVTSCVYIVQFSIGKKRFAKKITLLKEYCRTFTFSGAS